MKKIIRLCVFVAFVFPDLSVAGQLAHKDMSVIMEQEEQVQVAELIKPLSIGDKVPDIEFTMVNHSSRTARLSDFKQKLIILDFWATWCGPCISLMPKMDSLQRIFKDQLKVILVNSSDKESQITNFFNKSKEAFGQSFQLPSTVKDTIAQKLFPHESIPHYVWIDSKGHVRAITSSKEITVDNIQKILYQEPVDLLEKKDVFIDKLLDLEDTSIDSIEHYSFFKRGRIENLKPTDKMRSVRLVTGKGRNIRGIIMGNLPVLKMYETAIRYHSDFNRVYNRKRLILEGVDSSDLFFDKSRLTRSEWEKRNLCTYDLVVPSSQVEKLYRYMFDDLNRYSNYYAKIDKRKIRCLALVVIDRKKVIKKSKMKQSESVNEKDKYYIQDDPVSVAVFLMNMIYSINIPILNETNLDSPVSVIVNLNSNISQLRKELQIHGLDLLEVEREIDMLILSSKNQ